MKSQKSESSEYKKTLELVTLNKVKDGYTPLVNAIKIRGVKDAKRLLSRLIYNLQTGEINSQTAKDLCYLLISYVNITRDVEFEERLKGLEEKAGVERV